MGHPEGPNLEQPRVRSFSYVAPSAHIISTSEHGSVITSDNSERSDGHSDAGSSNINVQNMPMHPGYELFQHEYRRASYVPPVVTDTGAGIDGGYSDVWHLVS